MTSPGRFMQAVSWGQSNDGNQLRRSQSDPLFGRHLLDQQQPVKQAAAGKQHRAGNSATSIQDSSLLCAAQLVTQRASATAVQSPSPPQKAEKAKAPRSLPRPAQSSTQQQDQVQQQHQQDRQQKQQQQDQHQHKQEQQQQRGGAVASARTLTAAWLALSGAGSVRAGHSSQGHSSQRSVDLAHMLQGAKDLQASVTSEKLHGILGFLDAVSQQVSYLAISLRIALRRDVRSRYMLLHLYCYACVDIKVVLVRPVPRGRWIIYSGSYAFSAVKLAGYSKLVDPFCVLCFYAMLQTSLDAITQEPSAMRNQDLLASACSWFFLSVPPQCGARIYWLRQLQQVC